MSRVQRAIQIIAFALFLTLIFGAAGITTIDLLPADLFLRLDPLIIIGTSLSARVLLPKFAMGAVLLIATFFLGRFFCSTLCPLGATVDACDRIFWQKKHRHAFKTLPETALRFKYYLLIALLCSAALGVSWIFLASPLALATRFYGLVVNAAAKLFADSGLNVIRPLVEQLDWPFLIYARVSPPRFALQWFSLLCVAAIAALGYFAPRSWCRYLCPAGAIFAIFSRWPLIRRNVSEACVQCGQCRKGCPMGAIGEDPFQTDTKECIVCQSCVRVCPTSAISFDFMKKSGRKDLSTSTVTRRGFLLSASGGMTAAAMAVTGLAAPPDKSAPGYVAPDHLLRPPGALPEIDFLAACARCGACMAVCPTNTLQPLGISAGLAAYFSPIVMPRRGPCEPLCNLCGRICPTAAIRPVPLSEKSWIKIGTAVILRHKCLAWEHQKKCLVCDEVCPYDAVILKQLPDQEVAVPFVIEEKCAGCGYCHYHCPVQNQPAIVVEPMDALRIDSGSFRQEALRRGLSLRLAPKAGIPKTLEPEYGQETDGDSSGQSSSELPPGFSK